MRRLLQPPAATRADHYDLINYVVVDLVLPGQSVGDAASSRSIAVV
ncbi:hypothetical protein ACP70R_045021 [Stipagrostis hirtigluma subsp. patula]